MSPWTTRLRRALRALADPVPPAREESSATGPVARSTGPGDPPRPESRLAADDVGLPEPAQASRRAAGAALSTPPDEVAPAMSPLVPALIELYDRVLGAADLEPASAPVLARIGHQIEAVLALDHVSTVEDVGAFDPSRQAAAGSVPTDLPGEDSHVASTVRPGFRRAGTLLRRQEVMVYRLRDGARS